jgi:dihydrofolate reductase/thymidylate synthase
MNITLIANVVYKNNKFGLGFGNKLLYKNPEDMKFFKNVTEGSTVVMGYKTWVSLPRKPLNGRVNIVLTKRHMNCNPDLENVIFTNFKDFKKSASPRDKIFVIGGGDIYKLFLQDSLLKPKRLLFTLTEPEISKDIDTFLEPELIKDYKLVDFSDKLNFENLSYTFLEYIYNKEPHEEYKYFDLFEKILKEGKQRKNRTNINTISIFGEQLRFDISKTIPLMTSKKVSFKNIVEELLWFCRGETDANILKNKGVKIWDGNSSREFLDARGLIDYPEGECGPIYGHQWRNFNGVDQLKNVENLIKTDPTSRRIVLSAWNPVDLPKMALEPCHLLVQWYVNEGKLDCMFTMRSNDSIATNYNVISYAVLTYILAIKCGLTPGEIVYSVGDCHIYESNLEATKEQLKRDLRPFPSLKLCDSIKEKDWSEIIFEDFRLVGYFPNKAIKMSMAV